MTRAPVVVAYDGSPHSTLALQWAIESAALFEQPLAAVIAAPTHRHSGAAAERDEHQMELVRSQAAEEVRDVPGATVELRKGAVMAVLLAAARIAGTRRISQPAWVGEPGPGGVGTPCRCTDEVLARTGRQ